MSSKIDRVSNPTSSVDEQMKVIGSVPYSFSSPDMARNLVNDMTMYLYNRSRVQDKYTEYIMKHHPDDISNKYIRQYSNPRAAELHIDNLIQNVLRADRHLVQGDIVRKLPVLEAYAADYYGEDCD